MKILEIHIYGFGKLVDFHLTDLGALQVIYGENEAGKSTLMAFIQAVLFGFPSRQQAGHRYEPKTSVAYGGQLVLETEKGGIVTVERVRGKAAGEVTVTFANGKAGGEEALADVLNGLNKPMFQSIYSFNLLGLQEIRKLKGDDISRYLFAAGTVGTDALLSAEQELQKEMDALFKPNGRKPVLNAMLHDLRAREKELNGLKAQNGRYGELKVRQMDLQEKRKKIETELEELRRSLQQNEHLLKMWPHYVERKQTARKLAEMGPVRFPADGIRRLDQLMHERRASAGRLSAVQQQKKELIQKLEGIRPNPLFDEYGVQIQQLLDDWPQFRQWQGETERLEYERESLDGQITHLAAMLNLTEEEAAETPELDLSMAAKEKLRSLVQAYETGSTSRQAYLSQLNELEESIKSVEQQCARLEKDLVSEEAFRALAEKRQQQGKKAGLEADLERDRMQLRRLKQLAGAAGKPPFLVFIMAVLFLFAGVWSLVSGQYAFLAVSILALIFSGFYAAGSRNRNPFKKEILEMEREIEEKEKVLQNWKEDGASLIEYEQQKQLRENWKQLILQLEKDEQRARHIRNRLNHMETENRRLLEEIDAFKQTLKLNDRFQPGQLMDAFGLLSDLSQKVVQRARVEEKLERLKSLQSGFARWMEKLWSLLQAGWPLTQEGILELKKALSEHQENKILYQEWKKKLTEMEEQEQLFEMETASIDKEMKKLFSLADAADEEAFRNASLLHETYESLRSKLALMDLQLKAEDLEMLDAVKDEATLKQKHFHLEEKISEMEKALDGISKESAEIGFEIKRLEEGGTFTEKLHQYYSALSDFREEAEEWARLSVAKSLLAKMMERLRETRFPQVLKKAESYMNYLTDGAYRSLHLMEDGQFYVKRRDGMLFSANELSQATAEQLYIALRFSLAEALGQEFPSPIVIDDGFVNFDYNRTEKMARLLKKLSETRQVLLFTCQKHMLHFFENGQVKKLESSPSVGKHYSLE